MKDLVGELAPHAMAECGMDPAVSPTGCLVGIFGVWFLGVQSACAALKGPEKDPGAN
jgi:uncharacterized membrane protein